MMKIVDQLTGGEVNGQNSCVPYAVCASSSGCVMSTSEMAMSHSRGASRTGAHQRRSTAHSATEKGASTSREWLKPRW